MNPVSPAPARKTLVAASETFRALLAPALVGLPAQVSLRLVQQAEQTRDFKAYEAALHAEREISRNDAALQQGFARHLTGLLTRSMATSYAAYRPSIHDVPANTALRLVDTGEVEDSVLLMQIATEYRRQAGAALQELDVRIANLYGQVEVRERENPFRPYLIAKSIALAVADAPVDRSKVLAVTQHLAMALADQAADIYRQVNDLLRAAGISADLPSSMQTPAPRPAAATPASGPTAPPPAAGHPHAAGAPAMQRAAGAPEPPAQAMQAFAGAPESTSAANPTLSSAALRQPGSAAQASFQGNGSPAAGAPASDTAPQAPPAQHKRSALGNARLRLQQRLSQWAAQARAGGAVHGAGAETGMPAGTELLDADTGLREAPAGPMLRRFLADASRAQDGASGRFHAAGSDAAGGAAAPGSHGMQATPDTPAAAGAAGPAGSGDRATHDPAAGAGQGAAGELLAYLTSPQAAAVQDPRMLAEPFPNLIFENRLALEERSRAPEELITIDLVGMLFEFILLDQSVPAAIRAQIGRLQYYLLQVALAEPALMTESGHPARQLVNRIGTASLGAEDKPEAMTQVTDHVRGLVDTLLADALYRPEVLDEQLARFERFMREIVRTQLLGGQPGAGLETQRLIDTLESTSRKALQREQLAGGMASVLAALQVPDFVQAFLTGRWVDIIVAAGTPAEAVRSRELVPMLAWSVLPKSSRASRQQLLSALGNLVRDLKAGLQQHGGATEDTDLFLKRLMRTHRSLVGQTDEDDLAPKLHAVKAAFDAVLRVQLIEPEAAGQAPPVPTRLAAATATTPASAPASTTSATSTASAPSTASSGLARPAMRAVAPPMDYLASVSTTGAGVVASSRADAGLPDDLNEVPDELPEPTVPGVGADGLVRRQDEEGELVRNRLCTGAEVEIDLDGTIQRGMLVWRDSTVKNMLLSFSNGRRPVAVSVRLFRVLLGKGRARFLEAEPLFERAVFAVLDEAQAQHDLQSADA